MSSLAQSVGLKLRPEAQAQLDEDKRRDKLYKDYEGKLLKQKELGSWLSGSGWGIPYLFGDEQHPKGYNFLGPGTKIVDRLSLNYKGETGTTSSFLPADELDYQAFIHDLLYFSPDEIVKAHADAQMVRELPKLKYANPVWKGVVKDGIGLQYMRRAFTTGTTAGLIGYGTYRSLSYVGEAILALYRSPRMLQLAERMGLVGLADTIEVFGERHGFERFARWLTSVLPISQEVLEEQRFLRGFGDLGDLVAINNQRAREAVQTDFPWGEFYEFAKQIFPLGWFYAISGKIRPLQELETAYDLGKSIFFKPEKFTRQMDEFNKVKTAYDTYLDEVSVLKKGRYMIKDNIDGKVAEEKYIEFYDKLKDYLEFNKAQYFEAGSFKEFDQETSELAKIPELNYEALGKVSSPRSVEPPPPNLSQDEIKKIQEEIDKIETELTTLSPPTGVDDKDDETITFDLDETITFDLEEPEVETDEPDETIITFDLEEP